MEELKNRIEKIEKRNKSVETDKAWETSWTRRICFYTFISFFYFFNSIF